MQRKIIAVIISLLMLGNLAQGIVLCFGSDGHVSVEVEATDCCDGDLDVGVKTFQNLRADTNYPGNMNSCGNCVDIPLSGNCETKGLVSFVTKKPSPTTPLSGTITSATADNILGTPKQPVVKLWGTDNDTLTSICTTVLII